jgi:hypothetical protein
VIAASADVPIAAIHACHSRAPSACAA